MMLRKFRLTDVAMAACALSLSGCASTAPEWESRFGDATRQLKAQQLIDPAAQSRNAVTQPATDGRVVREGVARYLESFQTPPPTTVINIGTGR
jgi:hypothetical protein